MVAKGSIIFGGILTFLMFIFHTGLYKMFGWQVELSNMTPANQTHHCFQSRKKGGKNMKWNKIAVTDIDAAFRGTCAMCLKPVSDAVFCADNFDELQCLLLEKDSGLGIKLVSFDNTKLFCVCQDCKIRIDEDLKSDSVHIMYCE